MALVTRCLMSMHGAGPGSAGLMEAAGRAWSRERLGLVCERTVLV